MKTRGTRNGILLTLEPHDTAEGIAQTPLQSALLAGNVYIELAARTPWPLLEDLAARIARAGGRLAEVRPPMQLAREATPPVAPQAPPAPAEPKRGETTIVSRTVRSGGRVESTGSVIVIGDVNAGAEILAADDIIVLGVLRGVAHAGATGNEKAFIWAQQIGSKQLRIADKLAQAGNDAKSAAGPEVAQIYKEQIIIRPWEH